MYKVGNALIFLSIHVFNALYTERLLHVERMLHEATTFLDHVVKNREVDEL